MLKHIVKINASGGIFTPINLKQVAECAMSLGVNELNFGPRQEIYFNLAKSKLSSLASRLRNLDVEFEIDTDIYPNIVSSYVAEGVFSGDYGVTEGIYKDILNQFEHKPKLKINVCDSNQCLIPLFSGELNFSSSGKLHYWYLYICLPHYPEPVVWNKLIYSTDIPKICREFEELYLNNGIKDLHEIMRLINENTAYLFEPATSELKLPKYAFPYYEGMNKYGDKFWLGIFRRNYRFSIDFIIDLCSLCMQLGIGQLCITTWRTLLIKGIEDKNRILFEKLLGKYGINLRHSTTDLNWVVQDINSEEVAVKDYLVQQFDGIDQRTYGLVFGIQLEGTPPIAASIIVKQKPFLQKDSVRYMSTYDVYYKQDFNPNAQKLLPFAKNVSKQKLFVCISELCKMYYDKLADTAFTPVAPVEPSGSVKERIKPLPIVLYTCKHCYTVYDASAGDSNANIPGGTPFESLPKDYKCPTCDAPKSDFTPLEQSKFAYAYTAD